MASYTTSPSSAASEPASGRRTIGQLWRNAVAESRSGAAYLVETESGWREVSWAEAADHVEETAYGLLAAGVRKGDAFGILATTRLEWALFDFSLALIGAIGAPVYANSSPKDSAYVLEHSDAVGVLVEDEAQRAKVSDLGLAHELTFADLDELRARGREYRQSHPAALDEAAGAVAEDDLFTYIYTSGTTGPPKGCMITHRNYHAMVQTLDGLHDFLLAEDVMLLYLPLAHNFGRLMHLVAPYAGYTIAFCPDPLRIAEVLPRVRPTVLPSVPRIYEKVHTAVLTQFDEADGLKRRLIDWSLDVGRRASTLRQEGRPLPLSLALRHRLADRLVYSKVKKKLGGRLRVPISGGAPLAQEIGEFFHALDILILEGWGLTECTTAAAVNRPDRFRFGTVGPALPGFEVRTEPDGEILVRSETVFAGYYKDEEATRAVIGEDGWLHSGDVGEIDADGFVRITDRKKDLIVTAGGKNVSPQNLENDLKASKYVSQALVIGDRRPYLIALLTLDENEIRKRSGEPDAEVAELARRPEVNELLQRVVDEVNADRSPFEQLKAFAILPRDFSMDEDEITPTLKLKRRMCEAHFADIVEDLYVRGRGVVRNRA